MVSCPRRMVGGSRPAKAANDRGSAGRPETSSHQPHSQPLPGCPGDEKSIRRLGPPQASFALLDNPAEQASLSLAGSSGTFGKPSIRANWAFRVKHLRRKCWLWTGIDHSQKTVDNHVSRSDT
jgi:hypothetical protein